MDLQPLRCCCELCTRRKLGFTQPMATSCLHGQHFASHGRNVSEIRTSFFHSANLSRDTTGQFLAWASFRSMTTLPATCSACSVCALLARGPKLGRIASAASVEWERRQVAAKVLLVDENAAGWPAGSRKCAADQIKSRTSGYGHIMSPC